MAFVLTGLVPGLLFIQSYAGRYNRGGINSSLNLNTNAIVRRKLGRRAFLQAATNMGGNDTRVKNAVH